MNPFRLSECALELKLLNLKSGKPQEFHHISIFQKHGAYVYVHMVLTYVHMHVPLYVYVCIYGHT